jgi:signal transduction histidine kinase
MAESVRVGEARRRAEQRLRRHRSTLRPLALAFLLVVVVTSNGGRPGPGLHGAALGVTLALLAFVAAFGIALASTRDSLLAAAVAVLGATGVALTALQPSGAAAAAGGAGVWLAMARLQPRLAVSISAGITVALGAAALAAGRSASAVVAAVLLCALLGIAAFFIRRSRESHEQAELLLAELEDARDEQLRAAALAERGRIAAELHDVLAHALSGAAIQLQGARKLAEREQAGPEVRAAIDRAGELVREGLANAREAVGALRGDSLPDVSQLDTLVASFRIDTSCSATLRVEGAARTLPPDVGLALYRGAQEALTNIARYAPGADADVLLQYERGRTRLTVTDAGAAVDGPLDGVGGGHGLAGLRERVERVGGTLQAGPTTRGWRVELEVPV